MNTLTTVLNRAGITVPDQTIADLEIPILTDPQRQGDILITPKWLTEWHHHQINGSITHLTTTKSHTPPRHAIHNGQHIQVPGWFIDTHKNAPDTELATMTEVPAEGIPVVIGEATGNTHLLQPDPGSRILWRPTHDSGLQLGVVHIPDGGAAWLIHTDEHGANGIGPGTFTLTGKREQADELRRVAD